MTRAPWARDLGRTLAGRFSLSVSMPLERRFVCERYFAKEKLSSPSRSTGQRGQRPPHSTQAQRPGARAARAPAPARARTRARHTPHTLQIFTYSWHLAVAHTWTRADVCAGRGKETSLRVYVREPRSTVEYPRAGRGRRCISIQAKCPRDARPCRVTSSRRAPGMPACSPGRPARRTCRPSRRWPARICRAGSSRRAVGRTSACRRPPTC